ncbi:hypothetical protein [Runella slithyformis]|uniref:Uncharacterized protein n=1 Tax=Runella slithyformis (strain ATCC 29530 / DSM 19594 / LMG 11500 / NCIMB 11436 / LSU 4) TaxID=761193 RepID=A0A7U4E3V6_RUNSL|nr:hypothetical protein [Runella slithyformis]AEI46811.1 hypothetical protein Runsl_0359 [Runella slithyformis DSM 19594]
MKYITNVGETIEGASTKQVVEALRDGSRFSSDETVDNFMRGFAYRHKTWSGIDVRWDTVENFMEDLTASGWWLRVE